MVVTDLPSTMDIGVAQARVACPSMCTVQAPHDAMPQPNFVPVSLRCSRRTQSSGVLGSTPSSLPDYLPPMAPVSTNTLSWLEESDYSLASYRAFLRHARKPSSHDQRLPRHGVWPTCGPNCAAYIAHSFPGTLGLFCRTRRLPPHTNSAKP